MFVALSHRGFTRKRAYLGAARFQSSSTSGKSTQSFSRKTKEVSVKVAELYLLFTAAVVPRLATGQDSTPERQQRQSTGLPQPLAILFGRSTNIVIDHGMASLQSILMRQLC